MLILLEYEYSKRKILTHFQCFQIASIATMGIVFALMNNFYFLFNVFFWITFVSHIDVEIYRIALPSLYVMCMNSSNFAMSEATTILILLRPKSLC